jgi:hypothetical protein
VKPKQIVRRGKECVYRKEERKWEMKKWYYVTWDGSFVAMG